MTKSPCDFCSKGEIKVAERLKPCFYHWFDNQQYSSRKLSPQGFCQAAYHAVYPYCLTLLYQNDRAKKRSFRIRCPSTTAGVLMEVSSRKISPPLLAIKKFLEKTGKFLYRPTSMPNRLVRIKIIEVNHCPKRYFAGQVFKFNVWNPSEICPASFAQIYPWLLGKQKDLPFLFSCPDNEAITYFFKEERR